jgi:hypothetical protein
MKSRNSADTGYSQLKGKSVFGLFCILLGVKDLLAWAEFTSVESGWLARVTGADWAEPFASLGLTAIGVVLAGPSLMQCFGVRDDFRRRARTGAMCAAFACAALTIFVLETMVPSKDVLFGGGFRELPRETRQIGLVSCAAAALGYATFLFMRRRDVGFWKVSFPIRRENDIWSMSMKAEISLRAIRKNDEVYRMIEARAEYIQSEIGGKFDELCRHLAKESADLATIDSTARLQMDVGHVFKRYADFHVRLAETRHRIADDLRQVTNDTLVETLEHKLPGQKLRAGLDVSLSISYPNLHDADALRKRREEWDETMRGVVSIGASKGNEIIGEWIDRAARGDITAEEMPAAMELMRALCAPNGKQAPLEIAAHSS